MTAAASGPWWRDMVSLSLDGHRLFGGRSSDAAGEGTTEYEGVGGGRSGSPGPATRLVTTCGEAWNVYGPTEATVTATAMGCPKMPKRSALGRPLGNYRVYVLDPGWSLYPWGSRATLHRRPGCSPEVRNRPELRPSGL